MLHLKLTRAVCTYFAAYCWECVGALLVLVALIWCWKEIFGEVLILAVLKSSFPTCDIRKGAHRPSNSIIFVHFFARFTVFKFFPADYADSLMWHLHSTVQSCQLTEFVQYGLPATFFVNMINRNMMIIPFPLG